MRTQGFTWGWEAAGVDAKRGPWAPNVRQKCPQGTQILPNPFGKGPEVAFYGKLLAAHPCENHTVGNGFSQA